ncbi:MAG: beta-lactamase family protein [Ruminococcus sp.]|jgi:CubicO group peptidase (beta-lactamase class C family)|nr:beta-lactamase family protein [Ruminococcus sp.]
MNKIIGNVGLSADEILANGYNPERLSAIERHFERLVESECIYGAAWCVAHKGNIIAKGALGAGSGYDSAVNMTPDVSFRIASLTKLLTAAAVMTLVEDGFIILDRPIAGYIKEFPFGDITPYHLLTHTSGLHPDGGCFPDDNVPAWWDFIEDAVKIHGRDFDWIKAGLTAGRRRAPNTEWMYNTFGFIILGEMITRVTGVDVHDYMAERIFKPIGMNSTSFEPIPALKNEFFAWKKEQRERFDAIANGTFKEDDDDTTAVWNKIPRTGGGLFSTLEDLVKFGETCKNYGTAANGAHILGRPAVTVMTADHLFNIPEFCWGSQNRNRAYGIGFDKRRTLAFTLSDDSFSHEGAGPSALYVDRKADLTAAWFAPWNKGEWCSDPLWNAQNVIWSGIM